MEKKQKKIAQLRTFVREIRRLCSCNVNAKNSFKYMIELVFALILVAIIK